MPTKYEEAYGHFTSRQFDVAAPLFREAFVDAQNAGDAAQACHALKFRSLCLHELGHRTEARRTIDEALQYAQQFSTPLIEAHVLNTKAVVCYSGGFLNEALSCLSKALKLQSSAPDDSIFDAMRTNRTSIRSDLGQLDRAHEEREQQLRELLEQPITVRVFRCLTNSALDCIRLGDFKAALGHLDHFDELRKQSDITSSDPHALMHRAQIARYQDKLPEAEEWLEKALRIAPPSMVHGLRIESLRIKQQQEMYVGLLDDWRDVFDEVQDAGISGTLLAASAGFATALWAIEGPEAAGEHSMRVLEAPETQEFVIQRAEPLALLARIEVETNPSQALKTLDGLIHVPEESWVYRAYIAPALVAVHTLVGNKTIANNVLLGLESKVDEHDNMGDLMAHRRIHQLRELMI